MTSLPAAALVVAAATIAVGIALRSSDVAIGTPLPPFVGPWAPRVHPLAVAAALTLAGTVALAPRLLRARPAAFAAATLALTLVLRLAVGAARHGPSDWWAVFDPARSFEAKHEYLPALNAFTYGPGWFVDRFAELVPALPVHSAGHPPGLLLTLHSLGITSAGAMAALCIGVGALATPLAYGLGRAITSERRARFATLLLLLSPDALLFGATSADAVYLTLGLIAAWPLASSSRARALLGGALAMAAGWLFSWSLPAVAVWAALVRWRRAGWRAALAVAVACAAVSLLVLGALAATTGYDPVGALRSTEQVYRLGIASRRPYEYWVFGSPVAFLVAAGLPVLWLSVRALAERDDLAVAIFAVIAVAALSGFSKAETERIWLFLAPFVCLAAAGALRPARLRLVLGALAAQALAMEILLYTVW